MESERLSLEFLDGSGCAKSEVGIIFGSNVKMVSSQQLACVPLVAGKCGQHCSSIRVELGHEILQVSTSLPLLPVLTDWSRLYTGLQRACFPPM